MKFRKEKINNKKEMMKKIDTNAIIKNVPTKVRPWILL